MEVNIVNKLEYSKIFRKHTNIFCDPNFVDINAAAFDEIRYILFVENQKSKAGLIMGKRDNAFFVPTLAPFSGFNQINDTSQASIDAILPLLINLVDSEQSSLQIVLPPLIYDAEFNNLLVNSFFRSSFSIAAVDINYHIGVKESNELYLNELLRNGRKNLKAGLKNESELVINSTRDHIVDAYNIIRKNREEKGYPLRMSLEKVLETAKVVPADFFILKINQVACAAAQVFHITDDIVQVIYWGDEPGYEDLRAMNVLAYKIHEYYISKNIKIIDVGPSTEDSIPNYGLCKFKSSIGCSTSLKFKFIYESSRRN